MYKAQNKSLFFRKRSFQLTALISAIISTAPIGAQEDPAQEEVVVYGIRSSIQTALDTKRDAANFVDAISAEDIGKFPDQNVAEALQRVPGITINREGGEGQGITVRGFGPQFNVVRFNKRQMATTTGDRAFDFQAIPAELLIAAEIEKTPNASTPDGGIGGTVNMRSIRPLKNPELIAGISAKARYEELGGDTAPVISALFSNAFFDDTFGVALGLQTNQLSTRRDYGRNFNWGVAPNPFYDADAGADAGPEVTKEFVRRPTRAIYGLQQETRDRLAANLTLQFQPNDTFEITVDTMMIEFDNFVDEMWLLNALQIAFNAGNLVEDDWRVDENGTVTQFTKLSQPSDGVLRREGDESSSNLFGINFKYTPTDQLSVELDLSSSNAQTDTGGHQFGPGTNDNQPNNVLPIPADKITNRVSWSIGTVANLDTSFDLTDRSLYRGHFSITRNRELEDTINELQLDIDYQFEDSSFFSGIEAGVSYMDREFTDFNYTSDGGVPIIDGAPLSGFGRNNINGRRLDLPDEVFTVVSFPDLLADTGANFPRSWAVVGNVDAYCQELRNLTGNMDACVLAKQDNQGDVVTEENMSAYFQLNIDGEIGDTPVRGNVGLRYVTTETSGNGFNRILVKMESGDKSVGGATGLSYTYEQDPVTMSDITEEVVESNDYSKLLPSLNLSFNLNEDVVLRYAMSQTITRPNPGDIGTSASFGGNLEGVTLRAGNPFLKPFLTDNIDLAMEWYGEQNAVSFSLFHRNLKDYIATVTQRVDSGFPFERWADPMDPTTVVSSEPIFYNDVRKRNRSGGKLNGFEFAFTHNFTYLPGFLQNLGTQLNYTHLDSRDKLANSEFTVSDPENVIFPDNGIEGFAPDSYNIIAFYEDEKVQFRLAYNFRDDYLRNRLGPGGLPQHVLKQGIFDASFAYSFTDQLKLTFEGVNLTNEPLIRYADRRDRVNQIEYTGTRYNLGLRYTF